MERVRSGLRVPYDLNAWLIQEAEKQGVAKNALVLQILWEWAERHGKPPRTGTPAKAGPAPAFSGAAGGKDQIFPPNPCKIAPLMVI